MDRYMCAVHEAAHAVVRHELAEGPSPARPLWDRIVVRTVLGADPNLSGEHPDCGGMVYDLLTMAEGRTGTPGPVERGDLHVRLAGLVADFEHRLHLNLFPLAESLHMTKKSQPDAAAAIALAAELGVDLDVAVAEVQTILAREQVKRRHDALVERLLVKGVLVWADTVHILFD